MRVYPPCDTSGLQILPLERRLDTPAIISVAQFRPEKAHTVQLEAFAVAIRKLDAGMSKPKLQFVGSCRNKADEERLQNLRNLAVELNVDEDVEFHKNVMYRDLVRLLGNAVAGIHSMTDEHFGISVVDYMAAGAIPIAHYSAGPKMDILLEEDGQQCGFLAQNVNEYPDAILKILICLNLRGSRWPLLLEDGPAGFQNRDFMKTSKPQFGLFCALLPGQSQSRPEIFKK